MQIIGEVGLNHNGNILKAHALIDMAARAGCTAVKFQTFHADEFIKNRKITWPCVVKKKMKQVPLYDIFKNAELPDHAWADLAEVCHSKGVEFISTPSSLNDLHLLLDAGLNALDAVKIGSSDLGNLNLIREAAGSGLPVIMSMGMASEGELISAIRTAERAKDLTVMLCTSLYPCPPEEANLKRLQRLWTLSTRDVYFQLGYSDHTTTNTAAVIALAKGARVFECHITDDKAQDGPDHYFSRDEAELTAWVNAIREADKCLGSPVIAPTKRVLEVKDVCRSLVK